ncbi:MAG: AAA family ATPase [Thaumarchaeota archaeon]|nr:AAA family ATPase [Nitrososphaerota archaeon]
MKWQWNYDRMTLIGESKCGKTTFAKKFAKHASRVIALDANYEWAATLKLKPVKIPAQISINTCFRTIDHSASMINAFIMAARRNSNFLMILEDLDLYTKHGNAPKEVDNLMINGRHQNIGTIAMARRLIGFPPLILQQSKYLVIYKLNPLNRSDYEKFKYIIPNLDAHYDLKRYDDGHTGYIIYKVDSGMAEPIFRED